MDLDDVQNYVRANLPSYMIPAQYYIVDSIPLNANGKIDRKQLERLLPNFSFTPASQPVTEEESELIWLWKDLLRMQDIGPDDSFLRLEEIPPSCCNCLPGFKTVTSLFRSAIYFPIIPRACLSSICRRNGRKLWTLNQREHKKMRMKFF